MRLEFKSEMVKIRGLRNRHPNWKQFGVSAGFLLMMGSAMYQIGCAIVYGEVRMRSGRWINFNDQPVSFAFDLVAHSIVLFAGILWFLILYDNKYGSAIKAARELGERSRNRPEFERPEFVSTDTTRDAAVDASSEPSDRR